MPQVGRIQVTAFQSAPANRRAPTPIPVRPAYSRSPSPLPYAQAPSTGPSDFPPLAGDPVPPVRMASPARAAPAASDSSIEEILPTSGGGPSRIKGGGPSDAEEQVRPLSRSEKPWQFAGVSASRASSSGEKDGGHLLFSLPTTMIRNRVVL